LKEIFLLDKVISPGEPWSPSIFGNDPVELVERITAGHISRGHCRQSKSNVLRLIFYTTVSEVIDYQRVAVLETA
jgi:hypothetical protein